jgi:hypothetical protein
MMIAICLLAADILSFPVLFTHDVQFIQQSFIVKKPSLLLSINAETAISSLPPISLMSIFFAAMAQVGHLIPIASAVTQTKLSLSAGILFFQTANHLNNPQL